MRFPDLLHGSNFLFYFLVIKNKLQLTVVDRVQTVMSTIRSYVQKSEAPKDGFLPNALKTLKAI